MVKCDECGNDVISYYEENGQKLCFSCYQTKQSVTDDKEPKQLQEIVFNKMIKKKEQWSYDALKKIGLVFMLKLNDYLGILKDLEKDEILVALTKSDKPSNAKVYITNKRIMMRKYLDLGTYLGVDFDFYYSDIDEKSIMIRGFTKSIHFNAKGDHIVICNIPPYKLQDVIKELVKKNS